MNNGNALLFAFGFYLVSQMDNKWDSALSQEQRDATVRDGRL